MAAIWIQYGGHSEFGKFSTYKNLVQKNFFDLAEKHWFMVEDVLTAISIFYSTQYTMLFFKYDKNIT